jgi:EmrB/QacA subfamily drug resistance transporter
MDGYAPGSSERGLAALEDPALGLSQRAKMQILFAVMLGLFLGALDQTIVGPALPTIVTQLSGNDYYVWVVTVYLLTSTISIPFWGKLSDLYGRKPAFMTGIGIFLAGSALSGLSQSMAMLILFRGIQGIGAGSLFPVALAIIGDLFSPKERGRYQGLFGAVFGVAFIVGPLVGGFLTQSVSWHWIFYVNLPIGIVSLYVISRLLPTVKTPRATGNFDILGGAIFTVAITLLLLGLTNKGLTDPATHHLYGWADPTVGGLILASLLGIVLFVLAEARAKEPIVPLRLFRIRSYSSSMVSTFFASFAFFGTIVFLPRWFQFVHDFSPTSSGLALLPLMVGLISSSIASGFVVSRTGHYRWLLVGSLLVMGLASGLMTQLTASTPIVVLSGWMLLAGLGVGPSFTVFTIVVQNAVPFHELGVATANLTFFRQIGASVALAVAGTIFGTTFLDQLGPQVAGAGVPQAVLTGFGQATAAGQLDVNNLTGVGNLGAAIMATLPAPAQATIAPYVNSVVTGIEEAFSLAVAQTFWIGVAAAIIAAFAAAAMHETALRTSTGPAALARGVPAPTRTADRVGSG